MALIEDLLLEASEIRDAEQDKENTALRVGTMLVHIIEHIAGFVDAVQLRTVLEDYAKLERGLTDWRNSRIVPLASMGYDLDNIDCGDWNYSERNGDVVYDSVAKAIRVVGEQGNHFVVTGVIYVNLHNRHTFMWDATSRAMVAITDPSKPTVIDYRVMPPYNDIAVGETYYYESGTNKKIAVKLSSTSTYTFDPDPSKIYAFKDSRRSAIWDAGSKSWLDVGSTAGSVAYTHPELDGATTVKDALDMILSRLVAMEEQGGGGGGVSLSKNGDLLTLHLNPSADAPMLLLQAQTLDFGEVERGKSEVLPLVVSGKNLSEAVTLTVTAGSAFGLSTSSTGSFSQSVELPLGANGKVAQTIYIRFAPTAISPASATVTATSGIITRTLDYAGEGVAQVIPTITLNAPTDKIAIEEAGVPVTQSFTVVGRNLEGDITLAVTASGNGNASLSVTRVTASEAAAGKTVTINYTPTDLDGDTLTVTASSPNAESKTVRFTASSVERMATGSTFDYGLFTFTVLDDRSTVSVKYKSLGTGELVIPATAYDGNNVPYRVTEVAEEGFSDKTGITSVTFEDDGVQRIRKRGFAGCTGITSVVLPNSLTHVGTSSDTFAFSSTKITTLTIPSNVMVIGTSAFYNCTALNTVILDGMTSYNDGGRIENNAFVGCTGLERVICRATLEDSSSWATTLPGIIGNGSFPKISGVNAFGHGSADNPTYIKLLVPDDASVTAYSSLTNNWSYFKSIEKEA